MKEGNSKKPQADDKGLNTLLGSTQQTSHAIIADDEILTNLIALDQGDKLRQFSSTFTIHNGDRKSDIINTAGKVGLILSDNINQPANLALYTLNSDAPIEVTDPNTPSAFIIGSLNLNSDWYGVKSLDDGIELYKALISQGLNVTILVSANPFHFNNMVKHFAEVKQVIVTATIDKKDEVTKPLLGVNVKAIITTFDLLLSFANEQTLDDVLSDPETIVKDLLAEAWGKLGDIADPDSKATPYPIEAWGKNGDILYDAIKAIIYHAQVASAMAGNGMLGALATIIQQYINAPYVLGDKFMPVSLFILTEGDSGSGKSRTVGFSHKALVSYQEDKRKEDRQLLDEWKAQKTSTLKKDLEVWLLENPKPKQFILLVKSGTIQGFLDHMLIGNTRDIAWSTAEAALFLSGHSLTSDTAKSNISQLCDIWSDGSFDRLLSPRYDSIEQNSMNRVRFTLDLQGQPSVIAEALNDNAMNEQGLLPRFLFAFPENMNGKLVYNTDERLDAKPNLDTRLQFYWQRCYELLDPSQGIIRTDDEGKIIRFDMPFENRQARKALADYQTAKERQLCKGGQLEKYASYARRLHENASRIASILAYFNGQRFISADDIHRATLLTDYSMSERIRYTDKPQAGDNDAQKLIGWLVKYCNRQSVNRLAYSTAQSKVNPKHLRKKHNFELIAEVLESEGYIKIITSGRVSYAEEAVQVNLVN
ncbi:MULTISPECIES: DUF3987 domain-containing protein [unclassified Psychrobacter]|uniref:DUF3987 domain-containing protein n=1 Tax=unclassified Psychrobacter TaxID=196806 RepID=UPI0007154813|nr:DUF3987 domain-containing protein [Psychrobacter sp. P11F6]KRG34825.1 hypothetical protein AK822_08315 [Psychrobacter sp. P11F6]